jgi:predicted CoA-binding protein
MRETASIVEAEDALAAIVRAARVVAVVGMKDDADPFAPAHSIPRKLQSLGIRVIPVNPKLAEAVLGERPYPSLAAVPDRFDVVDIFRRSEAIGPIADEILALPADRRPAVVWMQTGIRNDDAAARLVSAGIQVVMDRCLGVYGSRYRTPA